MIGWAIQEYKIGLSFRALQKVFLPHFFFIVLPMVVQLKKWPKQTGDGSFSSPPMDPPPPPDGYAEDLVSKEKAVPFFLCFVARKMFFFSRFFPVESRLYVATRRRAL